MQILNVKIYNQMKYHDWKKACEEHKIYNQADLLSMPDLGCYCFLTRTGEFRQSGYIAFQEHKAYWFKTKTEALQKA